MTTLRPLLGMTLTVLAMAMQGQDLPIGQITSSGGQVSFESQPGPGLLHLEYRVAGAPTRLTVTVFGCPRGEACTVLDKYVGTTDVTRWFRAAYDSYRVTATWSGGDDVALAVVQGDSKAAVGSGVVTARAATTPTLTQPNCAAAGRTWLASAHTCGPALTGAPTGAGGGPQREDGQTVPSASPEMNVSAGKRILTLKGTADFPNQILAYNQPAPNFTGSYNTALTWNEGTYLRPNATGNFVTTGYHAQDIVASDHASSIYQTMHITTAAYNIGDKSLFAYLYGAYMPGTAIAGSDEGTVVQHMKALPSAPFSLPLNSDAVNTKASTALHWLAGWVHCAGNQGGSGLGSKTCLTAGQMVADLAPSDTIHSNLHVTGFKAANSMSPMVVTVAETLTPDVLITSTASLDFTSTLSTGDTVTIPFTASRGFADPVTGHACISSANENMPEEVGYTIHGSNITLTGHRFHHFVPKGGALTIRLNSCNVAYWIQDAADNAAGSTNGGGGKTYYVVVGVPSAHTMLIASSHTGSRWDGALDFQHSVRADGGARSAFNVVPAALVVSVSDPGSPFFNYAPSPMEATLGTNSVPWAAGKVAEEGYWAADQFFFRRDICDTPLANMGEIGSECNYMEVRGSVSHTNHYRYTNDPALEKYRGLPEVVLFEPYHNNDSAGAVSYFARGGMVPTYCWLCSTRVGPGGSLDRPKGSHYLWAEGASANTAYTPANQVSKSILVDDGDGVISTGSMPWKFQTTVTAKAFVEVLQTPPSSSAPCTTGQFQDDANYHYVCVAPNMWKRVALSSF